MKRIVAVVVALLLVGSLSSWGPGAEFGTFQRLSILLESAVIGEIIQQVQEDQLRGHICQLQSIEGGEYCNAQGSRWSCQPSAIDRAIEYTRQHFEKLGLKTELVPFPLSCRPGSSNNVEAVLPGTDPQSQQSVLITAHLDSTIFGVGPGSPAPGADDNASGSAAVLEAARVLSQYKFKHTIRFVLFTGEEQGLVGSRAYAGKLARDGAQVLGVFNMDMIGYDSDDNGFFEVHAEEESLQLADLLVKTISTYEIKLVPEVLEDEATNRSDHASFWSRGYPAILAIEDTEYGETNDFNPHYHSPSDTLQFINLPYARHIAQAVIGAVAQLAEPVQ